MACVRRVAIIAFFALMVVLLAGAWWKDSSLDGPQAAARGPQAVPLGHAAVGTLLIHAREGTFAATVVYLRLTPPHADLVLREYRDGIYRVPGLGVEAAVQDILATLDEALEGVVDETGGTEVGSSTGLRLQTEESLVLVQFAKVDPKPAAAQAGPTAADPQELLETVHSLLGKACNKARAVARSCSDARPLRLSAEVTWDGSMERFFDLERPAGVNVFGPLSWVKRDALTLETPDGATPVSLRAGDVFLPWSVIVYATFGFLLSFPMGILLRLLGQDDVLPLPLLGAFTAAVGLALVDAGIAWWNARWFMVSLFGVVYGLAVLWVLARPAAVLDGFSWIVLLFSIFAVGRYAWNRLSEVPALLPTDAIDAVYQDRLGAYLGGVALVAGLILAGCLCAGVLVILLVDEIAARLSNRSPEEKRALGRVHELRARLIREGRLLTPGRAFTKGSDFRGRVSESVSAMRTSPLVTFFAPARRPPRPDGGSGVIAATDDYEAYRAALALAR